MSRIGNTSDTQAFKPQVLERFPVFAGLKSEEMDALLAHATLVRAPKDAVLFDAKHVEFRPKLTH